MAIIDFDFCTFSGSKFQTEYENHFQKFEESYLKSKTNSGAPMTVLYPPIVVRSLVSEKLNLFFTPVLNLRARAATSHENYMLTYASVGPNNYPVTFRVSLNNINAPCLKSLML